MAFCKLRALASAEANPGAARFRLVTTMSMTFAKAQLSSLLPMASMFIN
jgi:hypothetical protein